MLLTELYLERGWRGPAVDKLLLGRLADLAEDSGTRERLCAIATDQLPDGPGSRALRLTDGTLRPPDAPAGTERTGPMLHSREDGPARLGSVVGINSLVDIAIVAVLITALHPDLRGTRAVSLVIGVTVLFAVYAAARFFGLQLLTQILQAGVVGLFALVVVFQRSCGGRSSGSAGSGPSTGCSRRPSSGPSSTSPTRSPTPRRSSRPMAMGRSSSWSVTPASRKWQRPRDDPRRHFGRAAADDLLAENASTTAR